MQLYSLTFLYLFLPAVLIIYNLTPEKFKNAALTLISLSFFALAQPNYFLLFAGNLALQYAFSELLRRTEGKKRNFFFALAMAENVGIILSFSIANQLDGTEVPLGTMVLAFTAIGYFVDAIKGEAGYIRNFWELSVFLGFFGKLYRGPLIRAGKTDIASRAPFSLEETGSGLYLFLRGLGKYVLLALPFQRMYTALSEANAAEISVLGAWLNMVAIAMMIFYDFSGFCDMARGLGQCFGTKLPKNFYFPFQSPLVADFLDRFNMTVTAFFHHYVYDNLRTDKNSKAQFVVNTFLICMLCGIWFGVRMSYVLWGIYIAVFIIIEEFFLRKFLLKIPRVFARIYTFCITMLSMSFFSILSGIGTLDTFKAMLGLNVQVTTDEVSYVLSQNVLVLVLGAFFLMSLFSTFMRYAAKKLRPVYNIIAAAESALILALVTAKLIG